LLFYCLWRFVLNYKQELVSAARSRIGRGARLHQEFAGNCFENPSELCWSEGTGTEEYDCSGLVIDVAREVFGHDAWPDDVRHVRDIWAAAKAGNTLLVPRMEPEAGDLVVLARQYTIDGQDRTVPGHIGFVSDIGADGLRIIHAATSFMPGGRVEENPLRHSEISLGYIALGGS